MSRRLPLLSLLVLLVGCAAPVARHSEATAAVTLDSVTAPPVRAATPAESAGTDMFALEPLRLRLEPELRGRRDAAAPGAGRAFVLDSDVEAELDMDAALPVLPRRKAAGSSGYTLLKAGAFYGAGDLDTLNVDTGFAAEVVFGHELLPFLGIEVSAGYISVDGGAGNFEAWAVPLFLQARASLPVLIFEPYVGVGAGGIYVDTSFTGGGFNDFAFAGNAFLGLEVGLGNLAIGAEAKYLASDTIDSATDFSFEGWQGTLFVSLPF